MSFCMGDVVKLRSGGPEMTVVQSDFDSYICVFFNKAGETKSNHFPGDALELIVMHSRTLEKGIRLKKAKKKAKKIGKQKKVNRRLR